jgi:hypothetical protein
VKNLFHKRFVYNDLLALALAGIISLLFAQTAYGFFNTSYKKQEYRLARAHYIDESCADQSGLTPDAYVKLFVQTEAYGLNAFYAPQYLRLNFLKARKVKVKESWCVKTHYCNVLPPVGRPYIPIAYCKLLI